MERKLKHLEFIQSTVSRMSKNSFLLKGWAVTLVVALLAFTEKKSDPRYIMVAFLAILVLWFLDGYFLRQERLFRRLYEKVRLVNKEEIDFSMDVCEYKKGNCTWLQSTFSGTLIIFYLANMIIMLFVAYLFRQ